MSEPTKPPSPGPESPAPGGEDEDYSIREALARIALQACQEALQESGQQHRGDEHGERARTALELARASIGPPRYACTPLAAPGSPLSKETPGRLHSAEAGTRKLDSAPGSHEGVREFEARLGADDPVEGHGVSRGSEPGSHEGGERK